jgi:peptidyl-tRNA hydrolase, PTH2 family
MELVQYIVMNTSLGMNKGKLVAQGAHAAVSVIDKVDNKTLSEWKNMGMKKIVLKVNSEKELIAKFQEIKDAKLPAILISDAGRTQIPAGSKTAFACGPISEEDGKKHFSELKLL